MNEKTVLVFNLFKINIIAICKAYPAMERPVDAKCSTYKGQTRLHY